MKSSVSVIKNEIREQSCRYYHIDCTYQNDGNYLYFFAIGHWNVFLGFVPDYYTRNISKQTKVCLSRLADVYGLIYC